MIYEDLRGLSVLVTRPKPEGEHLSAEIRKCHGKAFYFPTIDIHPIILSQSTLPSYDWIIFTSPQAVYHSLHQIKSWSSQSKIAAIGGGTRERLLEAQMPVDLCPPSDWR